MVVRLIKGQFFVLSESIKGKVYIVDKNMVCNCKGFLRHNHCKHQKEVIDYIKSGKTVSVVNTQL